jgi:glucose-1-phosphate cytidylyltransferase
MDACRPLAKEGRLLGYRHQGFWQPADTVKERHALEAAYRTGNRPWMLWEQEKLAGPAAETRGDPLPPAAAALDGVGRYR